VPTNISSKNIIKFALNVNQTALKQSLRHIGIDIGLAFFGILVGIILMVNALEELLYSSMIGEGANINRFLDDI
jgi:tetrahydromethanopterin S-methyltransferase subunit G